MTNRLKLQLESRSTEKNGESTCFYISQADRERQAQQRPLPEYVQTGHFHGERKAQVLTRGQRNTAASEHLCSAQMLPTTLNFRHSHQK